MSTAPEGHDSNASSTGGSLWPQVRRFGSHSAVYAIGAAATRLVGFVLVPVYTKHLPRQDYGILGILALVSLVVTAVFGLGLINSFFRLWPSAKTAREQSRLLSTTLWAQMLMGALCMGLALAAPGWWARVLIGSPMWGRYVLLAVGIGLLDMLTATPLGLLRMEERPGLYAGTMFARACVAMVLAVYFVAWRQMGVSGVLAANLMGYLAAFAMLTPLLARRCAFAVDGALLREMLPFGTWYMLGVTAGLFWNMGDRYVLKYLLGLSAVGVYTLGHQLATTIKMLGQSFITAYLPMGLNRGASADGGRFIGKMFTYFSIGLTWVALGFSLLSPEIVRLLARNPAYYPALKVVPPLVAAFVLFSLSLGTEIGFYLAGRARYPTWATCFALALNLGLDFVLVPIFGIVGAAMAAVIAAGSRFALCYHWAQRVYPLPYEMGRIMAMLGLALSLHVVMFMPGAWWLVAGVKLLVAMVFPFTLWATGFFTPHERMRLREILIGPMRHLIGIE